MESYINKNNYNFIENLHKRTSTFYKGDINLLYLFILIFILLLFIYTYYLENYFKLNL